MIASIAVRACRENRLLEEGSVDVKAVIEKVERRHHEERYQRIRHRVHRQPAYTSYTIYFAYTVDGVEYHDDFTTRKGMFDAEYKKKIPEYALKVGIVTSPTGAAIRDIMNISSRRNPCVQLYLYPALVQGEGAVSSIVSGIHRLDAMKLDVLIVGRGGGSIEDLWAFNEEAVARAIFGCNTPVISAVGHETDVTISDYVADMRAPTPSAAAELAVFDYEKFLEKLRNIKYTLQKNVRNHWIYKRSLLENLTLKLEKMNPQKVLFDKRQQLDTDTDRLKMLIERKLMFEKHRLALAAERLNGMSPLKKLESGFAYVSSGGKNIKSIEQAAQGETLDITVCDGQIRAEVLEISDGRENDN